MATKRVIVWVGSILSGLGASALIIFPHITLIPPIKLGPLGLPGLSIGFGTTFEKFVYSMNVPLIPSLNGWLLFLSFGFLAFIWLDYVFKTDYLKK